MGWLEGGGVEKIYADMACRRSGMLQAQGLCP